MKKFKKHSAKTDITHYGVLIRRQFKQIFSNKRTLFSLLLQAPVMLIISLFVYDKDTFADGKVNLFSASTIIFVLVLVSALIFIDFPFLSPVFGTAAFFLAIYLTNVSVAAMGLLISSLLKNAGSAILPVLIVIIMQVVFSDSVFPIEGAARVLCYVTSALWGVSLIGFACDLNSYSAPLVYNEIYNYSPAICIIVMGALTVVCLFLAIVKLKRDYKSKE